MKLKELEERYYGCDRCKRPFPRSERVVRCYNIPNDRQQGSIGVELCYECSEWEYKNPDRFNEWIAPRFAEALRIRANHKRGERLWNLFIAIVVLWLVIYWVRR
jgi:hypothetical protein